MLPMAIIWRKNIYIVIILLLRWPTNVNMIYQNRTLKWYIPYYNIWEQRRISIDW
jgi:hypothetical protein